ncbi:MAG: ABC transporter permease [Firmicutes bacterium]|nr:ABC transporter permease [Bacillota bacterium]
MILSMVKRHLKCYFRDTSSVFFSMFGVLIIIGLYLLFLGSMIEGSVSSFAGEEGRFFIDSWIMGGVVAASTMTTTLGAYGIMVTDQSTKILRDFKSSPMKRWQLVLSYVISAMIIGMIMSLFTLVLAEIYISFQGSILAFDTLIKVLLIMILSVASSSAFVFFLAVFIKSSNAFAAVSTVIGTTIGFMTGIYIPIGQLPMAVQTVIKIFPISHSAALLRQLMMNEAIPLHLVPENFRLFLGINLEFGNGVMENWVHLIVLAGTLIVFYFVSLLIVIRRKEKE